MKIQHFLFLSLIFISICSTFAFSENSGSEIENLLSEASRLRSLNQLNDSIGKYEEALALKPNDPLILRNLGVLYFETANYEKAIDFLKKSVVNNPNDAYAHLYLGESCRNLNQFDSAQTEYQEALKINPDMSEALFGMGMLAEARGAINEAESYFRSVTHRNSKHADAFFHLGVIEYNQKKLNEAQRAFEQAAAINSQMVAAHYNMGLVFVELGQLEKARESFKRAITLDPGNPAAFYQIARTYEMQGFTQEAKMGYEEALKLNPNFAQAREALQEVEGRFDSNESADGESKPRPQYSIPLIRGTFGRGGFQPTSPFDSFRDSVSSGQQMNGKALLLQLGTQLIQELLNSRRQQN